MKLIALKDLPNRVVAGECFEDDAIRARILIRLGLAKEDTKKAPSSRQTYRRRDLVPDEATD